MLRLAQSLSIAAVFLAASIALAITARENSDSFQQCEKNQIQTDAPGKQEPKGLTLFFKRGAAFHCTAQFIEGHNAVITAIATVLLTFVTGGLVWTGYQQIRTTRAQLRAYVFVTSRDFTSQDDKDGKYVHHLKLINTGQTPAKMVQVVSTSRILDHPIDAKFDIRLPADPDKSMITIGAGGELMFDAEADKIFSANEITEITNPKSRKRLYSYGTVKYQDIFGRKQYTDFCLFFETNRNNPKHELRTRVSAPEHHNDAS